MGEQLENITVIVPFRNGHKTIYRLIESLPNDLPILIVDDDSTLPIQEFANDLYAWNKWRTNIKLVRLDRRGYFSGAVNRGIQECKTDVLILNQDIWFENDTIIAEQNRLNWKQLIEANRNDYALIGNGVFSNPKHPKGYIDGVFMFVRRDAIERVGQFSEQVYPLWGATAEYQMRACRHGFKSLPTTIPGLQHERGTEHYGSSIKQALKDEPQNKDWFIRTPPAISVIIPANNYGRFLPDAIASLIGGKSFLGQMQPQTFQSFEIVLVDYGSTDDTWSIMQSFANDWQGIRAIQTRDEGTAAACNAGIEIAHGRYIAMLDADDMMEANRLELMYRAIENNPHKIVYDDIRLCFGEERGEWWKYPDYDFELVLEKNIMHKGLLFPKVAWEEVGGYPKIMASGREDWAFNIALGLKGWCGVHIKQPMYLARRGLHNRSSRNTNPMWHQKFMEQLHLLFPQVYAGERPVGCCGGRKQAKRNNITPGKPIGVAKIKGKLPGAEGMVLLEYTAPDYIDLRCFHGAETDTPYWFGKLRQRGYVDARDVNAFCNFMMGRAFRIVTPEPVKIDLPKVETVSV